MAPLKVYEFGHPILRKKARLLSKEEIHSEEIKSLIQGMLETMEKEEGVGIAAPQVGQSIQLTLVNLMNADERGKEERASEIIVLINPVITRLSKEVEEEWEGCLSLPEVRGIVPRSVEIDVSYLDQNGEPCTRTFTGFSARVVQHEVDHLNGILFVDRMTDMSSLSTRSEMERQMQIEQD